MASTDVFIKMIQDRPINGKHSLIKKLGEGGHGAVYLGACALPCERCEISSSDLFFLFFSF